MRRIFRELNKTEKTFFRGKSNISFQLILLGKIETKAQILAMRLAKRGCWRPCYNDKCFFLFYFTLIIYLYKQRNFLLMYLLVSFYQ